MAVDQLGAARSGLDRHPPGVAGSSPGPGWLLGEGTRLEEDRRPTMAVGHTGPLAVGRTAQEAVIEHTLAAEPAQQAQCDALVRKTPLINLQNKC